MKLAFISILFLFTFQATTAVADEYTPVSIQPLAGSNCSQAQIELIARASGVAKERYRVTSSGNEFDYSSPALNAQTSVISGSTTRTIALPKTANSSSLIGVHYELGGIDLDSGPTANFFLVYSCTSGTSVYSCIGSSESCPKSMGDYLPHMETPDDGDFGTVVDSTYQRKYISIVNAGRLPLVISSISVEGKDAEHFEARGEALPYTIAAGEAYYITQSFRTQKAGQFSAVMKVKSSSIDVAEMAIPLSATAVATPHLSVEFGPVTVGKLGTQKAILGSIIVRNNGIARSAPGSTLKVTMTNDYSSSSRPITLLSKEIGSLAPGAKKTLRFSSKKHNFEALLSKYFSAVITGNKKQRGPRENSYYYLATTSIYHQP